MPSFEADSFSNHHANYASCSSHFQPHAVKSMSYLVSLLTSLNDQSALVVILQEIKALGLQHHGLLADNIGEISRLSQSGSSSVRILVHQLKDDSKKK